MKLLMGLILISGLSNPAFAKDCKKGKPCGEACIPQNKECSLDASKKKQCKKGKLCGDTCISEKATCSK